MHLRLHLNIERKIQPPESEKGLPYAFPLVLDVAADGVIPFLDYSGRFFNFLWQWNTTFGIFKYDWITLWIIKRCEFLTSSGVIIISVIQFLTSLIKILGF